MNVMNYGKCGDLSAIWEYSKSNDFNNYIRRRYIQLLRSQMPATPGWACRKPRL